MYLLFLTKRVSLNILFSPMEKMAYTIEWEMQDKKERIISLQYFH